MSSAFKLFAVSSVCAALLSACSSVSLAPVEDRSTQGQSASSQTSASSAAEQPAAVAIPLGDSSAAGTYTVKPGDTLYRISVNHGVNVNELMRVNGITDPTKLAVGRTLTIPGGAAASAPAAHAAAAAPAAKPAASEQPKAASSSVKTIPGTQETLIWPVTGKSVKAFTAESRGIDIAADRGTAVKAAAAGEVLLVSTAFKGYGNLVILRHGDGTFVTTYGQLQSIAVEKGARVKAGQKIGTVGGLEASNPLLHFEVRIAGKPVDPKEYLP